MYDYPSYSVVIELKCGCTSTRLVAVYLYLLQFHFFSCTPAMLRAGIVLAASVCLFVHLSAQNLKNN